MGEVSVMKPVIGLDIGGTKCAVILAHIDQGITISDKISFPTSTELGFSYALGKLYAAIDEMMARHSLSPEDVLAIGISCGGPLDSRKGVILCPPNLPGWENIPLPQMLKNRYGINAFLQNDANACALVEWKLGAGRGTENMIFLTMGTGMGAGIITEGRLVRGHRDMGGEVGHLRLTEHGPVGFSKAGSFEGHTGGNGIGQQARAFTKQRVLDNKPPQWILDGVPESDITAKLMAQYAADGNTDALQIFKQVGTMLGRGLAILVDILNPERIVVGSIFTRCEAFLRPGMEAALLEEAIPFSLEGLHIVPAQMGEALGDLASIMVALHVLGINPIMTAPEDNKTVLQYLDRLIRKHTELAAQQKNILAVYEVLRNTFRNGGKLLLCGNGGSCADAQHILGELMKGFHLNRPLPPQEKQAIQAMTKENVPNAADLLQGALPAIVLSEHSTLVTAFSNDINADLVFAQQVIGYGKPGDALMGISTGGMAGNVVLAAQTAAARGLTTIALTGGSGGILARTCQYAIIAPGDSPAEVQEFHLPIYHALCAMLEESFFGAG